MRYKLSFKIFDDEESAKLFVKSRGRRKANITPWPGADGKNNGFIVWYYV